MTTALNINNNPRFSFRRFALLWSFYRPILSRQLIIYFGASLLFAILTLLPAKSAVQCTFFTVIWTALPYMYELAPIVLAKHGDSRVIERLLPASAAEKLTFFSIYFFLIIPLVTYLLPEIALFIYRALTAVHTDEMLTLVDIQLNNAPIIIVMNAFSTWTASVVCLYVVISRRRNQVLMGILSVFAVNILVGLVGAVYGAASAFVIGMHDGLTGADYKPEVLVKQVIDTIKNGSSYAIGFIIVLGLFCISMLGLVYRKIKKPSQ